MKIQYEITTSDMADVMNRAVKRRQSSMAWQWRRRAIVPALLSVAFYLVLEGPEIRRVIGAALFFVVIFATLWLIRSRPRSSPFVAHFREQLGSDGPFPFEIELTRDALVTKQFGDHTSRQWTSVTKITEADAGIEFDIRLGGLIFVRDRAFKSAEERTEFLRLARQYSSSHGAS
jgi:hypothetical protein